MTNPIAEFSDSFGRLISEGITNYGNLPSYHTYTPTRYRLNRDTGAGFERVNLHYEDVEALPYFDDNAVGDEDVFVFAPQGGNRLQWKTSHRYEYVVGFDALPTLACAISREPQGDEKLIVGLDTTYPPLSLEDGYFLEHNASHDPKEADLYEKREGNILGERKTVTLKRPFTEFQRWELTFNWYNVGQETWKETYSSAKDGQINQDIGFTQVNPESANAGMGGRGPKSGAGRVTMQIEGDATTPDDFFLHAGSMAFFTLGDDLASFEEEWGRRENLTPTQSGEYEALFVIRKDPVEESVALDLSRAEAVSGPGGMVLAMSMDKNLLLDANQEPLTDDQFFSPPEQGVPDATAIQVSTDVSYFPDRTGTMVQTTPEPGGFQLVGSSDDRKTDEGTALREAKAITDGDYAVVLVKPDGANSDYVVEHITREGR